MPQRKHYCLLWLLRQQNYFQSAEGGVGQRRQRKLPFCSHLSALTVLVSGLEPCMED